MRLLLLTLLLCVAKLDAQAAAPVAAFGSVTVHVTCGDTNQPARLASVTLQPVGQQIEQMTGPPGAPKSNYMAAGTNNVTMTTGLDGSVLIPKVAPGRYYVIVDLGGYLSPVAQFSREEMNALDAAMRSEIEKTIPLVVVAAQQSSPVAVRLVRAASISGTLRYDDGSPVPATTVISYRRPRSGDWETTGIRATATTDDQGRFRISGRAPGEYWLRTILEVKTATGSNPFGYGSTLTDRSYYLPFYSGDGVRKDAAKIIKLGEGENSGGNDITIPVARLHSISGTVVDAQTGAPLNSARVALYFGGSKDPSAIARTNFDDATFHFDFVLEGDYILKVSEAKSVRHDDIAPAQGAAFNAYAPRFKEVATRTYGDYQAPYTVRTDVTGLTLPVTEAAPKPKAKPAIK